MKVTRFDFLLRLLACVALAAALPACSSYEQRWRAADRATPAGDPFSGRWEGRWESATHPRHGGRLRCLFTCVDAGRYRADFRANWLFVASNYTTDFQVTRRPGELLLSGEQDLGWLFGGVYRYAGTVRPDRFHATYASRYDEGTFEMGRPRR